MIDPTDSALPAEAEAAMRLMLMDLIEPLINSPEQCSVEVIQRDGVAIFVVCVTSEDLRYFTGLHARTFKSLQVIVSAVGAKSKRKFSLLFRDNAGTSEIKTTLLPEITRT